MRDVITRKLTVTLTADEVISLFEAMVYEKGVLPASDCMTAASFENLIRDTYLKIVACK
jgi:hypothetical protein